MNIIAPRLPSLDPQTETLLQESADLMKQWSEGECRSKPKGGMEEWGRKHKPAADPTESCGWYHGTWQYLRLLDMVATPPWYEFYNRELSEILRKKPNANVLICAAADYGMLATLHEAIQTANAHPTLTICDICNTPLKATKWYAQRNNIDIRCICDDVLTTTHLATKSFDLIVTDEFLTVLKAEYKPQIASRWRELLSPGGAVVTTAMIGGGTTEILRSGYLARAKQLLSENQKLSNLLNIEREELLKRFEIFSALHTRHMMTDEAELRNLLSGFDLKITQISTPGECVNPTSSFQIVATI